MSGFDTSNVTGMSVMFSGCDKLTAIKVPLNLKVDADLPAPFVGGSTGKEITSLPKGVTASFWITRKEEE